jgi:integrase
MLSGTSCLIEIPSGLRQSELFGLKWGDIDFAQATMNVTRSIAYGVVGRCKTESSQKPVPVHPVVTDALSQWRQSCSFQKNDDWIFASEHHGGAKAVLATSPFAKCHKARCAKSWHPKTLWLAHIPAYLFDPSHKCRDGIQGYARAVAAFIFAVHLGNLHTSCHTS